MHNLEKASIRSATYTAPKTSVSVTDSGTLGPQSAKRLL